MYYLVIDGVQKGPYPVERIKSMLAAGEIGPETLVQTEGKADAQPVSDFFRRIPPAAGKGRSRKSRGGARRVLAVIGVILAVLLVVAGLVFGYFAYAGSALDKSSKAYVDEAIPAIVGRWSPDELAKRESKGFQKSSGDQQLLQMFAICHKLGVMKSYKGSKGQARIDYTQKRDMVVTANYVGTASFEHGDAEIQLALVRVNDEWKIEGFSIKSPMFN